MGCFKTFTFNESAPVGDTPLFSAVYVPSTDKILGTMENYIVEFDATTGAMIRAVKAIAPMYGPMWLGLVNDLPWLSCRLDLSIMNGAETAQVRRDIFPIDTTTLQPSGPSVGIPAENILLSCSHFGGPLSFFGIGNKLIFIFQEASVHSIHWVDTTNYAGFGGGFSIDFGWWTEHGCTNGTDAYFAGGGSNKIEWRNGTNLNAIDYSDTGSLIPCSVEWVAGTINKPFGICADGTLIRVDDFATSTNTTYDLATLSSVAGIKPLRIRYRASDAKLYIPCQAQDSIIVFDPVAETATAKIGFDSPIDAVFTATKAFAVQSGLTGLLEIV